jgi:hypothetical protein
MDIAGDVINLPLVEKRFENIVHPFPKSIAVIGADMKIDADIVRRQFPDSFKITFDTEIAQGPGFTLEMDYVDQKKV